MALLPGSPAIDAGNPSGCTDDQGNLLKTDQRGQPRPDKEDTGGCDMGAYERRRYAMANKKPLCLHFGCHLLRRFGAVKNCAVFASTLQLW